MARGLLNSQLMFIPNTTRSFKLASGLIRRVTDLTCRKNYIYTLSSSMISDSPVCATELEREVSGHDVGPCASRRWVRRHTGDTTRVCGILVTVVKSQSYLSPTSRLATCASASISRPTSGTVELTRSVRVSCWCWPGQ